MNKNSWTEFINYINEKIRIENEILRAEASIKLIGLGDEEGIAVLEEMGFPTDSIKSIKAAINRKKTTINLMDAKHQKENKKESASFEKMIAIVELQLGYQLRINELTLSRWVGILSSMKEKHRAETEAIKEKKR